MKRMAKVGFILLCVFSISIVLNSCSKESTNERRIVGTWVEDSHVRYNYDANGTLYSTQDYSYGNAGTMFEFENNGSVIWDGACFSYTLEQDVLEIGNGYMTLLTARIVEITNTTLIWEEKSDPVHGLGYNEGYYHIDRVELKKK